MKTRGLQAARIIGMDNKFILITLIALLTIKTQCSNVETAFGLVHSLIKSYNVHVQLILKTCWLFSEKIAFTRLSNNEIKFVANMDGLGNLKAMNNIWFVVDMDCNDSHAFLQNVRFLFDCISLDLEHFNLFNNLLAQADDDFFSYSYTWIILNPIRPHLLDAKRIMISSNVLLAFKEMSSNQYRIERGEPFIY